MKKILAIAIATAISAPAMADLTIGGSAEYNAKDVDGTFTTELETNLDITAKATADNGMFVTVYTQLEATEAADDSLDVDDMYMQLGNATADVLLGDFGTKSAYNAGADMAQPTSLVSGFDANDLDDPQDSLDVAVNINAVEGVTIQYASTLDTADTANITRLYVGASVGGVALAANLQDKEGDTAQSGFAVSASTTVSDVAVSASYAKNDADTTSTTLTASFSGLSLAVNRNDSSSADATTYYGAYSLGDMGIPGVALTVGAGGGDATGDVVAARINYAF